MRQYVYTLEQEIAKSIGFVVPKNNVIITRDDRDWGYNQKTKCIHTSNPRIVKLSERKAEIDFAVAHEFAHMIQDFVIRNRIVYKRLTRAMYERALRTFFKNTKINISYMQFYCFKQFLKHSVFQSKDMMRVLRFDDKYYVSGNQIMELMPNKTKLYFSLYAENTMEITANMFATKYIYYKYTQENQPAELFNDLAKIINGQIKPLIGATKPRSQKQFVKQISISRYGKHYTFLKILIETLKPETSYAYYDFKKIAKIMEKCINEMKVIVIKTENKMAGKKGVCTP